MNSSDYSALASGDVKVDIDEPQSTERSSAVSRTKLNVLGICCAGEVPIIRRILEPLPGVKQVSVNFTTRTVTVVHNSLLTPSSQLAKVLNEARMDASVLHEGIKPASKQNHLAIGIAASGVFLFISFFYSLYAPLEWFALVSVLAGAPSIILKGLASLRQINLDINVLMLVAVVGAIGLKSFIEAGSIVFLFSLADWLQLNAVKKASNALAFAADLVPQVATLAQDGSTVSIEDIKPGMHISVKAGEMIPVDGVLVSGRSTVDESSFTGESRPVTKGIGDHVWAGTTNLSGYLIVETTSIAEDSAISRMIKQVEEAQSKRSHTELAVETFAKYYTPAVVAVALATTLVPLVLHAGNEKQWIYLSLIVVVVACPCALVISTPVTVTCAIARAARSGLVIKGGDCLEVLAKLNLIAIDKTGTLTEGNFRIVDLQLIDSSMEKQQLVEWVAGVESQSIHPIASAFAAYARLIGVSTPAPERVSEFQTLEGQGVSAVVDGDHLVEIGNARLAFRRNWSSLTDLRDQNSTICWVGVNEKLAAVFTAADQIRPESLEAIQELKEMRIRTMMLTGDNRAAAASVSEQLGGIEFHAELLPKDKVDILELERKNPATKASAMVGDGVNDAPALAAADVGIAMGVAGSAMAMETADIALMMNDLRKLAAAKRIGVMYRRVVIQNIVASLVTKALVLALALVGYAPLWAAVLGDVGTCVAVTFNGMRLLVMNDDSYTRIEPERNTENTDPDEISNSRSEPEAEEKNNSPACKCCASDQLRAPLLPEAESSVPVIP